MIEAVRPHGSHQSQHGTRDLGIGELVLCRKPKLGDQNKGKTPLDPQRKHFIENKIFCFHILKKEKQSSFNTQKFVSQDIPKTPQDIHQCCAKVLDSVVLGLYLASPARLDRSVQEQKLEKVTLWLGGERKCL